ncbi:MAG: CinA family protein [Clostridia bacterium]|nr:CinA family protein [Clostridia bacterium]
MYNEQEIRNEYAKLTKLLIEKNLTITTMESCTSGQIASLITDTEGASSVLKGAFVTYCNESKIMQGVPEETIEKYSVYSKETACAMAEACRKAYNADVGVGVTGSLENVDPENENASKPGSVWFSFSFKDKVYDYYFEFLPQSTRFECKMMVAEKIVCELLKVLC